MSKNEPRVLIKNVHMHYAVLVMILGFSIVAVASSGTHCALNMVLYTYMHNYM